MRNCLSYAVLEWFRQRKATGKGGYIKIRKSLIAELHGVGRFHVFHLVPHFLHETRDGKVTQLVRTPEENAKARQVGPWRDWLWLWHFQGHVIDGDEDYKKGDE